MLLGNQSIWRPCQFMTKKLEIISLLLLGIWGADSPQYPEIPKITQISPIRLKSTTDSVSRGQGHFEVVSVESRGKRLGTPSVRAPQGAGTLQIFAPPGVHPGVISAKPQTVTFPQRLLSRPLLSFCIPKTLPGPAGRRSPASQRLPLLGLLSLSSSTRDCDSALH